MTYCTHCNTHSAERIDKFSAAQDVAGGIANVTTLTYCCNLCGDVWVSEHSETIYFDFYPVEKSNHANCLTK